MPWLLNKVTSSDLWSRWFCVLDIRHVQLPPFTKFQPLGISHIFIYIIYEQENKSNLNGIIEISKYVRICWKTFLLSTASKLLFSCFFYFICLQSDQIFHYPLNNDSYVVQNRRSTDLSKKNVKYSVGLKENKASFTRSNSWQSYFRRVQNLSNKGQVIYSMETRPWQPYFVMKVSTFLIWTKYEICSNKKKVVILFHSHSFPAANCEVRDSSDLTCSVLCFPRHCEESRSKGRAFHSARFVVWASSRQADPVVK